MEQLTTWVGRINPNDVPATFVLLLFLLGIWRVFTKYIWPFFVGQYWPARIKRQENQFQSEARLEEERNELIATMRDAVLEMKSLNKQLVHSVEVLLTGQQAIMSKLEIPMAEKAEQ